MFAAALLAACTPGLQAADGGVLAVSALVVSKSNCKFNAGAMVLDFGNIDPAGGADVTATATKTFSCGGSAPDATFVISAGNGLYFDTGSLTRRMQHSGGAAHLPYSLTLSPTTATVPKNAIQTLTVTGKITQAAFQNALLGSYSDTVTITLTP